MFFYTLFIYQIFDVCSRYIRISLKRQSVLITYHFEERFQDGNTCEENSIVFLLWNRVGFQC